MELEKIIITKEKDITYSYTGTSAANKQINNNTTIMNLMMKCFAKPMRSQK